MCKKLLALVALLGMVSVACAIDDFESYGWQGDLEAVWSDVDGNPSTTAVDLIYDVPQGSQGMNWDYHVAGGWSSPDGFGSYDNAQVGRTIDPLDFQAGGSFKLWVRPYDADLARTNWYLLQYSGDAGGAGQTWIPTAAWIDSTGMWWQPHEIPAIIAPTGWTYVDQPWYAYHYGDTPVIYAGNWGEITIKDNMWVPWGPSLESYDAMTGFNIGVWTAWTDSSGASGAYRVNSTGGTVWPLGPITGEMDVDDIRYIPEPATIALLGLGGLALLRKRS